MHVWHSMFVENLKILVIVALLFLVIMKVLDAIGKD